MNYNKLATSDSVNKTVTSLKSKGYDVSVVANGQEALESIKNLIPTGASVMNGSSTTLNQIGYTKFLEEGKHSWIDLHAKINAENDKDKRDQLRRESVLSDYYLGSVHALVDSGVFVIASNTGSQLPHVVSTSPNLIFVSSTKKIVPTLDDAMKRLESYVIPLENERMMKAYNVPTVINKVLIFHGENPMVQRKIHFILIEEDLGF